MCRPLAFLVNMLHTNTRALRRELGNLSTCLSFLRPGAQSPGPQKEGEERNDGKGEDDRQGGSGLRGRN